MKTFELSNEKARVLVKVLARSWAERAVRLAASDVPINTPYRNVGEALASRTHKARIAKRKQELLAIGATLEGVGIALPKANRKVLVGKYTDPRGSGLVRDMWFGGRPCETETLRLVAEIKRQLETL